MPIQYPLIINFNVVKLDMALHTITAPMNRKLMFVLFIFFFKPLYAYDCGFGASCTLQEMATFLDRSKHLFNTSDYVYDNILSEGNSTIVFDQRLLVGLTKRERKKIKKEYVNKSSALRQICSTPDLKQMLNQKGMLKSLDFI